MPSIIKIEIPKLPEEVFNDLPEAVQKHLQAQEKIIETLIKVLEEQGQKFEKEIRESKRQATPLR